MFELSVDTALDYVIGRGLLQSRDARVEELPGGVSCVTVRVHPFDAPAFVIKQALAKLRVAADWRSDPARAEREVLLLQIARNVLGESAPRVLDVDLDNYAFSMESAPLEAMNWKSMLLQGDVSIELAAQCGRILAGLHGIPIHDESIPQQLFDKTFFRQLRIEAYFLHVAEKRQEVAQVLRELCEQLLRAQMVITHADYTPKNFLVHEGKMVLLDYEVAHIGHPAFDVASILNHFFLKSVLLPGYREQFWEASEAFLEAYLEEGNWSVNDEWLWRCLGGLMLARVEGKSPVEYLRDEHKPVVIETALRLLRGEVHDLTGAYDPQFGL